jgi:hypothetical protein
MTKSRLHCTYMVHRALVSVLDLSWKSRGLPCGFATLLRSRSTCLISNTQAHLPKRLKRSVILEGPRKTKVIPQEETNVE